jgi:hypothetical protein
MKQPTHDEHRLTRYLLGQMSPEEQARLEERYLADPDLHAELRAIERELIDQYVHGELSNTAAFEQYFLATPSRRQKVAFARALKRSLAHAPIGAESEAAGRQRGSWLASWRRLFDVPNRVWQPILAMVVVLAVGWLVLSRRQEPVDRVAQTPLQPDRGASGSPASPAIPQPEVTEPPRPAAPPPRVATFILASSLTRSRDDTQTLIIDRDVAVRLELQLETGDYRSYRAVLRTAEGGERWNRDQLRSERTTAGEAVVVTLPAGLLTGQDYTIRISGVTAQGQTDEVGSYYFRVQPR